MELKKRLAKGTQTDKDIFNFIRSGKANIFLEKETHKVPDIYTFSPARVFEHLDDMTRYSSLSGEMSDARRLYAIARVGDCLWEEDATQDCVAGLWIIECEQDNLPRDPIAFQGLKDLVEHSGHDGYLARLTLALYPELAQPSSPTPAPLPQAQKPQPAPPEPAAHILMNEADARRLHAALSHTRVQWLARDMDADAFIRILTAPPCGQKIPLRQVNQVNYVAKHVIYPHSRRTPEQWALIRQIFDAEKGDLSRVNSANKKPANSSHFDNLMAS